MPGRKDVPERRTGPPRPFLVERRNLGRDDHATGVDFGLQDLAHEALAMAVAVRQSGIEERDPPVHGCAQGITSLAIVHAAPLRAAEAPAAKAELADGVARRAKGSGFHAAVVTHAGTCCDLRSAASPMTGWWPGRRGRTHIPPMIRHHERLAEALADRYRLDRLLGQGGMAIVLLAEDLKHRRKVAVKVLRSDFGTTVGAERFLREIEIAAALNHPNILAVHDSGEAAGVLYYVTPYVEGKSLRDRLQRDTRLPLEEALKIAREVADALDYAHRRGVIHGDIKPENILFQSGHAVVADFGIARAISAAGETRSRALTQPGAVIGTPDYMSPEQASGERELDGRCDQYALACVLYEMLAGQPPFTGPTMESVLIRHLTVAAPRITDFQPDVPKPVAAALTRAMAKAPADRFRDRKSTRLNSSHTVIS